jgi:hypothetical protein
MSDIWAGVALRSLREGAAPLPADDPVAWPWEVRHALRDGMLRRRACNEGSTQL